mmetsp:Transcript_47983/g.104315  ORF Transcript_47983/g.104315 Transcript_47983/m.104315 type:complete len:125 (+) Transcript_47983:71-445(+)|eukprot:CAMPEP_0204269546 /NCGR_PEP_ID=MMETSP0468-20130131/16433_1 /ASSEMBLY_ACC=CAM_ASM_000383 /TAXON_ID=2969 /ORGANISM="Oxyrrhis marina" /LENGTH=124 /DNA_ID=CAMNT_0051244947 /DNA_START=65 /DNA_END=439 /DNA_ORIENTATION=-
MRASLISVAVCSASVLRGAEVVNATNAEPMQASDLAVVYDWMLKHENKDCPFFEESITMIQKHAKGRGAELTTKQVDECLVKCGYPGGVMHMFGQRMVKFPFQCCPDSCYHDDQVTIDKCVSTC